MLHRTQDWIEPESNLCVVAVDAETIAIWKDSRIGEVPGRPAGDPSVTFGPPNLEMTTGRDSLEGLAVVDGRWLWTIHRDGELVTWDLSALDETEGSTALQRVSVEEADEDPEDPEGTDEQQSDDQSDVQLRLPVASEFDLGFRICEVDIHREAADTLIALGGETGRVGMLVSRSAETSEGEPPAPAVASSRGHNGDITALTFGPSMQRIASAGQDDRIMIWSTSTEKADPDAARQEPEEAEELDEEDVGDEARVVSAELQIDDGDEERDGVAPGDTSGASEPSDLPGDQPGGADEKADTIDTELSEDRPNRLPDSLLDTDIKPPEHDRRLPRINVLSGSQGWPLALEFSPSGDRLVSGAMDNAVYLWRPADEEPLVGLINEHHNWVSDVVFSADGSTVVSASWDGTLGVFDGEDLTPTYRITAHTDYVTGVDFTPGEARQSRLVSIGYDGRVGVWDWQKGKAVTSFQAHADWIEGVRWLDAGDKIRCATVASGGVVRVWGIDGTEIASFGGDSTEAFELGRGIEFADYVEVGRLASDDVGPYQRKEARLGEVRDYETQVDTSGRVQTETAVSMLESAIQEGPPAATPEGEEAEQDAPDEATALETFEAKLEESGIETPDVDPEKAQARAEAGEVPADPEQPKAELEPGNQGEPSTPEDATVPDDAPDPDEIGEALDRATSERHKAVSGDQQPESASSEAESAADGRETSGVDDETIEEELADLGGLEEGNKPEIETKTDEVDISVDADNPLGEERKTSSSIEEDLETAGATEAVAGHETDIEEDLEKAGATEDVELGGPSLDEDLETAGASKGVDLEGSSLDEDLEHAGTSVPGTSESAESQQKASSESSKETTPTPGAPHETQPPEQAGPPKERAADDPGKTIVPAQNQQTQVTDGEEDGEPDSSQTQQGTAVSPSAMPSSASESGDVGSDEDDDTEEEDHEFSDRPKSAEELREGLNQLSEQSQTSDDVTDTTAKDIWTEQSARARESSQETEAGPMSALAEETDTQGRPAGELKAWRSLSTPLDWVYGVAWRPGADALATCGQGGDVRIWLVDGTQRLKLSTSGDELNDVCFTPDGRVVVSGGDDGGVHLWMLPEAEADDIRHARLSGHKSWINAVATHPNGRWALSGSKDCTARLWNLETGECASVLKGHGGPVTSVGFTDNHIWTAGRDGLVAQWTMSGDRELQWTGYGEIIDLDARGDRVGWVTEAGDAFLLLGPEQIAELRSHTRAARGFAFDIPGSQFATGGADGRIHLYRDDEVDSPAQDVGTDSAIWTMDYRDGRLAVGVDSGDLRIFR